MNRRSFCPARSTADLVEELELRDDLVGIVWRKDGGALFIYSEPMDRETAELVETF